MTLTSALYERVLGEAWSRLGAPVQYAHQTGSGVHGHGCFRIVHGAHYLARTVARVLRFPRACTEAETRLTVTAAPDGELWSRTFDGRALVTRQYQTGASEMAERFGWIEFRFRLEAANDSLVYHQHEAAIVLGPLRVRIPPRWSPSIAAREDPAGARRLDVTVRVTLPGIGLLMAYDGFVEFEKAGA